MRSEANVAEKDIEKSIITAFGSSNGGKVWEGNVARELSKYDKITDFSNEFKIIENGNVKDIAGDIDVGSSKYIIECKESLTHNTLTTKNKNTGGYKILEQFDKYINVKNKKYINPKNKNVILAVKELNGINLSHPILKQLQSKGVKIITDLKQIKNLK